MFSVLAYAVTYHGKEHGCDLPLGKTCLPGFASYDLEATFEAVLNHLHQSMTKVEERSLQTFVFAFVWGNHVLINSFNRRKTNRTIW